MSDLLHPWLDSPEAVSAAMKAVSIPVALLPAIAALVGLDELRSEALAILTECALLTEGRTERFAGTGVCSAEGCSNELTNPRAGSPAKFCSPTCRKRHAARLRRTTAGSAIAGKTAEAAPEVDVPYTHVGSMHRWPEDQMTRYAIRTVGYALNNWLRTNYRGREMPSSELLANMTIAVPEADQDARAWLTDWLEVRGVFVSGDEEFTELTEAAIHIRGGSLDVAPVAA